MKIALVVVGLLGLAACTTVPREDPIVTQARADARRIAGDRIGGISSSKWTPAMHAAGYRAAPHVDSSRPMTYAQVQELYRGSAFSPPSSCPYDLNTPACRQWEDDRTHGDNRRLSAAWHQAAADHVCNSYNPGGCLSREQQAANLAQAQTHAAAVECYFGDGSACQRYPDGTPAAAASARQQLWESCLNTYRGFQTDRYGTEHDACLFLPR